MQVCAFGMRLLVFISLCFFVLLLSDIVLIFAWTCLGELDRLNSSGHLRNEVIECLLHLLIFLRI